MKGRNYLQRNFDNRNVFVLKLVTDASEVELTSRLRCLIEFDTNLTLKQSSCEADPRRMTLVFPLGKDKKNCNGSNKKAPVQLESSEL